MTYATRHVRRYTKREARDLHARSVSQLNLQQRWQIEKAKSIRLLGGIDPTGPPPTSGQREREQNFWFPRR
jgi:hypothetical protein